MVMISFMQSKIQALLQADKSHLLLVACAGVLVSGHLQWVDKAEREVNQSMQGAQIPRKPAKQANKRSQAK